MRRLRPKAESAELHVAKSSPQVPTRNGAKRPPRFAYTRNIAAFSIDVGDSALQSNIPKGKYIGMPQDHNAKDRNCPRADAFDPSQSLVPILPLFDSRKNLIRPAHYFRTAFGTPLRET